MKNNFFRPAIENQTLTLSKPYAINKGNPVDGGLWM